MPSYSNLRALRTIACTRDHRDGVSAQNSISISTYFRLRSEIIGSMDLAASQRCEATLSKLGDVVARRLARKRGGPASKKLLQRVAGMDSAAGHEDAVRRLGHDAALLVRIAAARDRVARGTFGICLRCHKQIGRNHIAAVPWAAFCTQCRKTVDSGEADLVAEAIPNP